MGYYDGYGWGPYVSVAERRAKAARKVAKLKKDGHDICPVEISGRKIARTFWGDAWCKNLERYSDYSNRLPRGRSYVRNGSVIDLQIEAGQINALVSGTSLYDVTIGITPLDTKQWAEIKARCSGQIGSLVELLKGSISKSVMEIVSRKGEGLFPAPREIKLSCSCPDWATMCKHVAATLYGVGARLDDAPEMLFALRGVDPSELIEAAVDQPKAAGRARRGRVLEADELSSVFGIDIDTGDLSPAEAQAPAKRAKRSTRSTKASAPTPKEATPKKSASAKTKVARKTRTKRSATKKAAKVTTATPGSTSKATTQSSKDDLQQLHARAEQLVEKSVVLRELVETVKLLRGRIYLYRPGRDLMARISPLDSQTMLLECQRGSTYEEHDRGSLEAVLEVVETDTSGAFHGLGTLATTKKRGAKPSAHQTLHRDLKIPMRVLAEPRYWYSMRRTPVVAEIGKRKDRALVRFVVNGLSGSFHGTCLYARRDGQWGVYRVKPNASETIASAEAWLEKRGWEQWR